MLNEIGEFMSKLPIFSELLETQPNPKKRAQPTKTVSKDIETIPDRPTSPPFQVLKAIPYLSHYLTKSVGEKIYYVYLITPDEMTYHTRLISFYKKHKDGVKRRWFYLEYNHKVYSFDEIDGIKSNEDEWKIGDDGNLTPSSTNVFFLSADNKLALGTIEFSENAKEKIADAERIKLLDRAFERGGMHMRSKYAIKNPSTLLLSMFIMALCIGILFILAVPQINSSIETMTKAARDSFVVKNSPIPIEANNTVIVIGNKTYQIQERGG